MRSVPLVVLALAGALTGQASVSPVHFTATESLTNNTYPFGGTASPFRYQQIHDDVPAMVVTGMQFRHDNTSTGTIKPAFSITLDAWISTAATSASGANSSFDVNHGPDKIQCVTNRTIAIPASDPTSVPADWLLDIPFDPSVVFVFAGAPASICWEVQITARTNTGSIAFDAVTGSGTTPSNPPLAASRGGTGCIATGQTQPILVAPTTAGMDWPNGTGSLTVNATRLENNGFFVWINGLDKTTWSGLPLPFALPGTTGAPSGTCTLYTDLVVLTLAQASPTGTASLNLTFAATPALHGFRLYTQAAGLDAAANPFGFTTSNLAVQQIVAPYSLPTPGCRIYLLNSLGATGTVGLTTFLVTRFY